MAWIDFGDRDARLAVENQVRLGNMAVDDCVESGFQSHRLRRAYFEKAHGMMMAMDGKDKMMMTRTLTPTLFVY